MTWINIIFCVIFVILLCIASPFFIFFCVKWGTMAFYKAQETIDKEKRKKDSEL